LILVVVLVAVPVLVAALVAVVVPVAAAVLAFALVAVFDSFLLSGDPGGIDSLFGHHEIWKGDAVPVKVDSSAQRRPTARRTLLDEAEVEGALRLFDDAAPKDVAPKEPAKD